jgi:hypothetical protein
MEFRGVYDVLFASMITPVCFIYATPPPFGQELFDQIMKIIANLKNNPKSDVETVAFEGTHHFHMLKPAETADVILKFLERKALDQQNNNTIANTSDVNVSV